MAITRAKQSSLKTGVTKYDNFRGGLPFTPTIGTATDGGTGTTVSVTFTGNNTAGLTYTALSTPGSLTGTSTTSPITVTGLSSGTAYTFAVKATNSAGDSPYSAASNSVTPATPSSFESIATATGTGSAGSITFSSIPSTYVSLQLRCLIRDTSTASNSSGAIGLQLNGDTSANYPVHYLQGDGSSATAYGANAAFGQTQIDIQAAGARWTSGTTTCNVAIIDIQDYASTTRNKTVRYFAGVDNNTGTTAGKVAVGSGLWLSTSAVTSLTLLPYATAFASNTVFSLYGIKGA